MGFIRAPHKPPAGILVKRTAFLSCGMLALSLFLYIAGTWQHLMEATQRMLLRLSFGWGLVLLIFSLYGCILDLGLMIRRRQGRFLIRALGYILLGLFGAASSVFAAFILIAGGGNRI